METIHRKGYLYRVKRNRKGRIVKFESLGSITPQYSLDLTDLVNEESEIPESKILARLRRDLPFIRKQKEVWYQVKSTGNLTTPTEERANKQGEG